MNKRFGVQDNLRMGQKNGNGFIPIKIDINKSVQIWKTVTTEL